MKLNSQSPKEFRQLAVL
ncbi:MULTISPECIES: hypothetical protein [Bacillus]